MSQGHIQGCWPELVNNRDGAGMGALEETGLGEIRGHGKYGLGHMKSQTHIRYLSSFSSSQMPNKYLYPFPAAVITNDHRL